MISVESETAVNISGDNGVRKEILEEESETAVNISGDNGVRKEILEEEWETADDISGDNGARKEILEEEWETADDISGDNGARKEILEEEWLTPVDFFGDNGVRKEILEEEWENAVDISGDNGVRKIIIEEGQGSQRPCKGCVVSLQYTGTFTDGTIFDSSVTRSYPLEFILGKDTVVKAFDLGVPTMKLGEKCQLICEPSYAYGKAGVPPKIPPDSTVIFELQVMAWSGEFISPRLDGGIEKFLVKSGEKNRRPNAGALVKAHITGKYKDNIFDVRDVEFDLDEGRDLGIIEGVEIAIEHMEVGEVSRFQILNQYAYGSEGNVEYKIPPHSTVEYTIQLNHFEDVKDNSKCTKVERLENALIYKEKGEKYLKKKSYSLAIKMCKKCLSILKENDDVDSNKIKVAAYSNLALGYKKTDKELHSKQMCDEVLKLEPDNIKILNHRGHCNLAIHYYNQALEDFHKVLQLDPGNKTAKYQLQILKGGTKKTTN